MPGLIGASMFSPRPARGYRFHSLQVEIIVVPPQVQKLHSFSNRSAGNAGYFAISTCHSEISSGPNCPKISRIGPRILSGAVLSVPHSPLREPSRDRDRRTSDPAAASCEEPRPGGRSATSKNKREETHAESSSDRSRPAPEK